VSLLRMSGKAWKSTPPVFAQSSATF